MHEIASCLLSQSLFFVYNEMALENSIMCLMKAQQKIKKLKKLNKIKKKKENENSNFEKFMRLMLVCFYGFAVINFFTNIKKKHIKTCLHSIA